MFDTLHIGGKTYQTKALGKSLSEYRIGDSVRVVYASQTLEEWSLSPEHPYKELPEDYSFLALSCDWNQKSSTEVSVLVLGGRLRSLGEHSLNRFSYEGKSIGKTLWKPDIQLDQRWQEMTSGVPKYDRPRRKAASSNKG